MVEPGQGRFNHGRLKVAIVGAGRLGTLLATRIPANCRKVVISQQKARAVALADEVGGLASDQLSAVRGCQVVFLAVPGSAFPLVLQEAGPHLEADALVVNMAAELMTDELAAMFPHIHFAAAKVIGHAREITLGSPGVVVLDHLSDQDTEFIRELLDGIGLVTVGKESKVMAAHQAVSQVMARAREDLFARLKEIGLAENLAQAAIASAGPGVLRSLCEIDQSPSVADRAERERNRDWAVPELSH